MTIHRFASTHSPSLKLKVRKEDGSSEYIQFVNGGLEFDDEKPDDAYKVDFLCKLLDNPSNTHLRTQFRYVDQKQAESVVRRHMAERAAREQMAAGPFTSAHAQRHMDQAMKERVMAEMQAGGASPQEINQALEQLGTDLPMTESGVDQVVRNEDLIMESNRQRVDSKEAPQATELHDPRHPMSLAERMRQAKELRQSPPANEDQK